MYTVRDIHIIKKIGFTERKTLIRYNEIILVEKSTELSTTMIILTFCHAATCFPASLNIISKYLGVTECRITEVSNTTLIGECANLHFHLYTLSIRRMLFALITSHQKQGG